MVVYGSLLTCTRRIFQIAEIRRLSANDTLLYPRCYFLYSDWFCGEDVGLVSGLKLNLSEDFCASGIISQQILSCICASSHQPASSSIPIASADTIEISPITAHQTLKTFQSNSIQYILIEKLSLALSWLQLVNGTCLLIVSTASSENIRVLPKRNSANRCSNKPFPSDFAVVYLHLFLVLTAGGKILHNLKLGSFPIDSSAGHHRAFHRWSSGCSCGGSWLCRYWWLSTAAEWNIEFQTQGSHVVTAKSSLIILST